MNADYEKYLSSPQWRARRREVRHRCGGRCERCGRELWMTGWHCHHEDYDTIYNESLSSLQALCPDCHAFVHKKSSYDPARIPTLGELKKMIAEMC